MTIEQFKKELNISFVSDEWASMFDDTVREAEELSSMLLNENRISDIIDEYKILVPYKSEILEAVQVISENKALSLFICLLYKEIKNVSKIDFPKGEGPEYRYYLLIPLIHTIPDSFAAFRKRGIPENIIYDTMMEYDDCMYVYSLHNHGKHGINPRLFSWMLLYVNNNNVRIARFNFEMKPEFADDVRVFKNDAGEICILADGMRVQSKGRVLGSAGCEDELGAYDVNITETNESYIGYPVNAEGLVEDKQRELSKSRWSVVLEKGDKVISVHIPRRGDLSRTTCEETYSLAREFFEKYYPDFDYKVFRCVSWLMDRQLKKLLKPGSNIADFLSKYTPYPVKSMGQGVFYFAFQFPDYTDIANLDYTLLPENTSLERALKKHYLKGDYVYEVGGVFLK